MQLFGYKKNSRQLIVNSSILITTLHILIRYIFSHTGYHKSNFFLPFLAKKASISFSSSMPLKTSDSMCKIAKLFNLQSLRVERR